MVTPRSYSRGSPSSQHHLWKGKDSSLEKTNEPRMAFKKRPPHADNWKFPQQRVSLQCNPPKQQTRQKIHWDTQPLQATCILLLNTNDRGAPDIWQKSPAWKRLRQLPKTEECGSHIISRRKLQKSYYWCPQRDKPKPGIRREELRTIKRSWRSGIHWWSKSSAEGVCMINRPRVSLGPRKYKGIHGLSDMSGWLEKNSDGTCPI